MDESVIENWRAKRQRYVAWWKRELPDPLICITAKRDKPLFEPPVLKFPTDPIARWTDDAFAVDNAIHGSATAYFGGDAVPNGWINTGPVDFAGIIGAKLETAPDTVWIHPTIDDLESFPTPRFDPDCPFVQSLTRRVCAVAAAAKGRYFVSLPGMCDAVTVLSQMRGVERFCIDLRERPGEVKRIRDGMVDAWLAAYDHFYNLTVEAGQDGMVDWVGLWGPGKFKMTECDFSVMIGPADFEWLVVPEQQREWSHMAETAFHLDGPDALKHLDRLLRMETLGAIQWIPGAGQPGATSWVYLARRILDAGKNVVLYCDAEEAEFLMDSLPHRGLSLMLAGVPTESQARDILRRLGHPLA